MTGQNWYFCIFPSKLSKILASFIKFCLLYRCKQLSLTGWLALIQEFASYNLKFSGWRLKFRQILWFSTQTEELNINLTRNSIFRRKITPNISANIEEKIEIFPEIFRMSFRLEAEFVSWLLFNSLFSFSLFSSHLKIHKQKTNEKKRNEEKKLVWFPVWHILQTMR